MAGEVAIDDTTTAGLAKYASFEVSITGIVDEASFLAQVRIFESDPSLARNLIKLLRVELVKYSGDGTWKPSDACHEALRKNISEMPILTVPQGATEMQFPSINFDTAPVALFLVVYRIAVAP